MLAINQRELALNLLDICLFCGTEIPVATRIGKGHTGTHWFCKTNCKTRFFHLSKDQQALARLLWSRLARADRIMTGVPSPPTAQDRSADRASDRNIGKRKQGEQEDDDDD